MTDRSTDSLTDANRLGLASPESLARTDGRNGLTKNYSPTSEPCSNASPAGGHPESPSTKIITDLRDDTRRLQAALDFLAARFLAVLAKPLDSDTMPEPYLECPNCGATIRARQPNEAAS